MVKHKESESESEGASHADEPRFRVRVCMKQFYGDSDVRARAYVCVSPRRRVRWLQRRLRRLFALPRVCLRSRGHLLPPQEPLALLQPDDPVEVLPVDAERDETAAARDVVDSVDDVMVTTVAEVERSPSPVYPDNLTETKRQALLMLEQICAESVAECAAEGALRPRRRRVRRRRRVPPADSAAADADHPPADSAAADADDEPAPAPGDSESLVLRGPTVVAMVLRNDLQPRAPRVVHPLTDSMTPTILDIPPTEIIMGSSN